MQEIIDKIISKEADTRPT